MRRTTVLFLLLVGLVLVGSTVFFLRRRQPDPTMTIEVNGAVITLAPGENVAPETYALVATSDWSLEALDWTLIDGRWEPLARGVDFPVEVDPFMLPDGYNGLPEETIWLPAPGREIPISLTLPASWRQRTEFRPVANGLSIEYIGAGDVAQPLFALTAFTEGEWQVVLREPGPGQLLLRVDGLVIAYFPALENSLTGAAGDEFQALAADISAVVASLAIAPLRTAMPVIEQTVSQATGAPLAEIACREITRVDWASSCLGLAGPGETCAAMVTPGWQLLLSAGDQRQLVHTDFDGTHFRLVPAEESRARQALLDFLERLNAGRYEEAAMFFGGEYDTLQDWNPTLDPADRAGLWRQACTVNGLRCLPVMAVTFLGRSEPAQYRYLVMFRADSGRPYVLNAAEEQRAEFYFTVRVLADGSPLVLGLPPYEP